MDDLEITVDWRGAGWYVPQDVSRPGRSIISWMFLANAPETVTRGQYNQMDDSARRRGHGTPCYASAVDELE